MKTFVIKPNVVVFNQSYLYTREYDDCLLSNVLTSFNSFPMHISRDLSNNSISQLPRDMFLSLWRLTILDLQNNLLTRLTDRSFNGLANLNSL